MTFLELQDAVLSDRFGETKRDSAKNWINYRYGRLWGAEPWTFKQQATDITVSGGLNSISKDTEEDIIAIYDATLGLAFGSLTPIRPDEFHNYAVQTVAEPNAYTIIGDFIWFNSVLDSSRTYTVVSNRKFVELVDDGDVPLIPLEFHRILIPAAAAEGLKEENDPSWQGAEDSYEKGVEDMKREYLSAGQFAGHYPSWPYG